LEIERRFAKGEAQKERRVSLDYDSDEYYEGMDSPTRGKFATGPVSPPRPRSVPKSESLRSPNHPLHRAASVGNNLNSSRNGTSRILAAPAINIDRTVSAGGASRTMYRNRLRNRYQRSEPQSDEEEDVEDNGFLSVGPGISIIETIPTPTDSPASIVSHTSRLQAAVAEMKGEPVPRSRVVVQSPPLPPRSRASEDDYEPSFRINTSTPIPIINAPEKMVDLASPTSPPMRPSQHYSLHTNAGGRSNDWSALGTLPRRKVGPADFDYIESEDAKGHKRFGTGLKNLVQTLKGK
jgi:hypothetical protein